MLGERYASWIIAELLNRRTADFVTSKVREKKKNSPSHPGEKLLRRFGSLVEKKLNLEEIIPISQNGVVFYPKHCKEVLMSTREMGYVHRELASRPHIELLRSTPQSPEGIAAKFIHD
jgi:hypothetical protein